jgi:hypothetical protein
MLKYGDKVLVKHSSGIDWEERVFICYGHDYKHIVCAVDMNKKELYDKNSNFLTYTWEPDQWKTFPKTRPFTWEERYEYLAGKWVKHKSENREFKITQFRLDDKIPYVVIFHYHADRIDFETLRNEYLFMDDSIVGIEE